jgi:hypothetical protein
MSEIDPETMREFKEAMQEALPFFKGLGKRRVMCRRLNEANQLDHWC